VICCASCGLSGGAVRNLGEAGGISDPICCEVAEDLIQAVTFARGLAGIMLACPDEAEPRHAAALLRLAGRMED